MYLVKRETSDKENRDTIKKRRRRKRSEEKKIGQRRIYTSQAGLPLPPFFRTPPSSALY
jgi:hypothetical protein